MASAGARDPLGVIVAIIAFVVAIALSGATGVKAASSSPPATLDVRGMVMAGGQRLADANVRLANGTDTGVSILAEVTADATGTFSAAVTFPTTGVLYAEATPLAITLSGSRLRLVAVVAVASGPAAGIAPAASIVIDELTTIASAYAMAQFQTDDGFSGPSPGLENAAAAFFNLVDPASGEAGGAVVDANNGSANATLATLNSLGNLLAVCAVPGIAECQAVLDGATPSGGTAPSDTADAAGALAREPTLGVDALWELSRQSSIYEPALTEPPRAWILVLLFTADDLYASGRVALDAVGNVWSSTNWEPGTQDPSLTMSVLDPMGQPALGTPIAGGGMKGGAWGMAIGQDGSAWAGSFGGDAIVQYARDGTPLSPEGGWTEGGLDHPQGLAIDQRGNLWIANNFGPESAPGEGNVIVYPGGDPSKAITITGGGLNHPFAVQIDGAGRAWVTNAGLDGAKLVGTRAAPLVGKFGGSVTVIGPDFKPTAFSPIEDDSFKWPLGLSIDAGGDAWVVNYFGSTVTRIASDGEIAGVYELPDGTLPWSQAVDGSGRIWVAGFGRPGVWLLCGTATDACPPGAETGAVLSPRDGFQSDAFQHFTSIQVDASGNLWLSNNWSQLVPPVGGTGLAQVIGIATPVCTPLGPIPTRPAGGSTCEAGWSGTGSGSAPASLDGPATWVVALVAVVGIALGAGLLIAFARRGRSTADDLTPPSLQSATDEGETDE